MVVLRVAVLENFVGEIPQTRTRANQLDRLNDPRNRTRRNPMLVFRPSGPIENWVNKEFQSQNLNRIAN
jgi:hypothetical protein